MKTDDERIETFLRQFTPKRPRPLPAPAGRPILWTGVAVAATVVLGFAILVRQGGRPGGEESPGSPEDPRSRTAAVLVSHVREWDVDATDRMLAELSARVLPDVERQDGTLHVLAREQAP